MRGKPKWSQKKKVAAGITPAHAGKTQPRAGGSRVAGDHPRACGENRALRNTPRAPRGSPPRMRGKQGHGILGELRRGITPAHAGKTRRTVRSLSAWRDHPRACGENSCGGTQRASHRGSPPRMRGKLLALPCDAPQCGITPAHAGKTLRKGRISVVDPSPQPRSSLTSRRADASIGSQRAPCAAPV